MRSLANYIGESGLVEEVLKLGINRYFLDVLRQVGIVAERSIAMKIMLSSIVRKRDQSPMKIREWIDRMLWQEMIAHDASKEVRRNILRVELPGSIREDLMEKYYLADNF